MKNLLVLFAAIVLTAQLSWAQNAYSWQGADGASWAVAANWNPTRTAPAATDILQFNTGTTLTITAVPTQTVGRLVLTNNTAITLQSAPAATLTISNGSGIDLGVPAGSSLVIGALTNVTMATGATASIGGTLIIDNAGMIAGTGTITATTASTTVTGVGTAFTTQLAQGSMLYNAAGARIGYVSSITNNTSLTLVAVGANAAAGEAFTAFVPRHVFNTNAASAIITVTGTIINRDSINCATAANLLMQSGSVYEHDKDGGTLPTATWNAASTLLVSGQTFTSPIYGNQVFGNVTIDAPGMIGPNATLGNANAGTLSVAGTLTIANTGTTFFSQFSTPLTVGNFVQTGGIFQMVGGATARTLNITGNCSLSGGTWDIARGNAASVATINIAGNFSQSGTTDTLKISATNANADANITFNGSAVQTFSKTGGFILCSNGPTMNFTIANGAKVDFGTSVLNNPLGTATGVTFTLATGGTLQTANTAGLATGAAGTIQVGGTRTYNTGTGTFYIYNGVAAQATGNALPASVPNLTINNAAGVTLSQATTVTTALTMTNGALTTTAANLLTLGSAATAASPAGTSWVNGPMRHTWTTTTVSKLFPLGKSTYEPLIMAFTTPSSPIITAEVFDANAGGSFVAPMTALSKIHYYQTTLVSGTATNAANTVTVPNNGDLVTTAVNLTVAKSAAVGGAYTKLTGTNSGSASVVTCAAYAPATGFVILGTTDAGLPVELTSFTASVRKGAVCLSWATATEVNNAGFEIQRRSASSPWQKLAFVDGSGSTNAQHSYAYTDAAAAAGTYAYRLKQIDINGAFEYSAEVEATVALTAGDYTITQNYPNPFNPTTSIRFAVPTTQNVSVKVFNVIGQEVAILFNGVAEAGVVHTMQFDATGLASGTYIYQLHTAEKTEVKRMLLVR